MVLLEGSAQATVSIIVGDSDHEPSSPALFQHGRFPDGVQGSHRVTGAVFEDRDSLLRTSAAVPNRGVRGTMPRPQIHEVLAGLCLLPIRWEVSAVVVALEAFGDVLEVCLRVLAVVSFLLRRQDPVGVVLIVPLSMLRWPDFGSRGSASSSSEYADGHVLGSDEPSVLFGQRGTCNLRCVLGWLGGVWGLGRQ